MLKNSRNLKISEKSVSIGLAVSLLALFLILIIPVQTVGSDTRGSENDPGPTTGTLMGTVTDAETNEPIEDALMTLKYHDIVRPRRT